MHSKDRPAYRHARSYCREEPKRPVSFAEERTQFARKVQMRAPRRCGCQPDPSGHWCEMRPPELAFVGVCGWPDCGTGRPRYCEPDRLRSARVTRESRGCRSSMVDWTGRTSPHSSTVDWIGRIPLTSC